MSIPTADLRALEKKWREKIARLESLIPFGVSVDYRWVLQDSSKTTEACADELHALIVKSEAESQVSDAEQRIAAIQKLLDDKQREQDECIAEGGITGLCYTSISKEDLRAALGVSPAPPKEGEAGMDVDGYCNVCGKRFARCAHGGPAEQEKK